MIGLDEQRVASVVDVTAVFDFDVLTYFYRKVIKNDMQNSSRLSVKTPSVSSIRRSVPDVTPGSVRLWNGAVSAVSSRTSSTFEPQSTIPMCGDSFFEERDTTDHRCINWSLMQTATELAASERHDTSLTLSHEANQPDLSKHTVHGSPLSTLPFHFTAVASSTAHVSDTWLSSQPPTTTSVSRLPVRDVQRPNPPSSSVSSSSATSPAGNSPAGLTYISIHVMDM